jgi:hypothetical protein
VDDHRLPQTVSCIAEYYNGCKVGYAGHEGYRKSTDLAKLSSCIDQLLAQGFIGPDATTFLDLGCADGRVNVLMSYFVKQSIGIERDADILAEYDQRRQELTLRLQAGNLLLPPDNIALFQGSSLDEATYEQISTSVGVGFADVDLFYTYITLHDLFAAKIASEAKRRALYLVYGFSTVLPRYHNMELLIPDVASQGIMALYAKGGS